MKTNPILDVTYAPEGSDIAAIGKGMLAYNPEQLGRSRFRRICVILRDGDGTLLGGMFGDIRRGWLDLKALWVAPQFRRQGFGSLILRTAEAEARKNGCRSVWLAVESSQAEPFYARFGFEVYARIPNCRPGRVRAFMRKSWPSTSIGTGFWNRRGKEVKPSRPLTTNQ